ncbi:MAG: UDP-glucose 4-epimerase GalE [Paludibacterium sp.]|uniref:UDP-glucose 4-epimerase GalE n=1 Tax=Paludibacterium sp. TaxID=1917523 RepID=UPI0025EEFD2E|nr:UDP-glucose 4-epimerase GalE [Paludibacterium sp.]MBV8047755.1 UDP-glucose 4-epimerase GalE [Paludibacterium sp.]MBV8648087.1 UDP-glucose 4-epimerase GalE [Paludibacterium sp.]
MSTILVTGGAGYIGSHTLLELIAAGHDPVVVDNFSNSKPEALRRVEHLSGHAVPCHAEDLLDRAALVALFQRYRFDAVIHFAALKAVGESVAKPLSYYHNNLTGTLNLLSCMQDAGVRNIVFSSSATVYADTGGKPITEDYPLGPTNPYGQTKLMTETFLRDLAASEPGWRVALLRYFNPVGAHESGLIGEDPNGIPNNLLPFVSQVAVGKLAELKVFGNDYPTPDGTGVRDYLHVVDLARAHVKALALMDGAPAVHTLNLGTGRGHSVLEMVAAFERASQRPVPYRVVARRDGDIASCFADPSQAERVLGWKAEHTLDDMCRDSWRWQQQNPNGYA